MDEAGGPPGFLRWVASCTLVLEALMKIHIFSSKGPITESSHLYAPIWVLLQPSALKKKKNHLTIVFAVV